MEQLDFPLLEAKEVSFAFPERPPLFAGVNLTVESGDFFLITGPSGAGKSSLLRLFCRLEEPDQGEMFLQGRPYRSLWPPNLRRTVLYIPQTPLVLDASVEKNLLLPFGFQANRQTQAPTRERINRLLMDFKLDEIPVSANAQTLSVGQKQRLCLIRGLLLEPRILLLDEPTSALDEESALVVEREVGRLAEAGLSVLMVSHRPVFFSHIPLRVLRVQQGRVEAAP